MRRSVTMLLLGAVVVLLPLFANSAEGDRDRERAAKLYNRYCIKCHPDPEKLSRHHEVTKVMRKPHFDMPNFTAFDLSDDEAQDIESYIRSKAEK